MEQYCVKDVEDHEHLQCKDCVEIHWSQGCSFGRPNTEFPDSTNCECCCFCK